MSLLLKLKALKSIFDNDIRASNIIKDISTFFNCKIYFLNMNSEIIESYPHSDLGIKKEFTQRVTSVSESLYNIQLYHNFLDIDDLIKTNIFVTIIPVIKSKSILGHLVLSRNDERFFDEELVLIEIMSLLFNNHSSEFLSNTIPSNQVSINNDFKDAIGSLSFLELKAMRHIFNELNDLKGHIVSKNIAERIGISRSIMVNAMRKLEFAGVIKTNSLGIKGTNIEILNPVIVEELKTRYKEYIG